MIELIITLIFSAGLLLMVSSVFMLTRNRWVAQRRHELIEWHFQQGRFRLSKSFDGHYGTYDEWMRRFWIWDAAKLAGLPEWIA